MIGNASYLLGVPAGAAIPSALIVQPLHAWVLLLSILAVACTVLWFLTRPLRDPWTGDPRPPRRHHSARRWRLPLLRRHPRRRPLQPGWVAPRTGA
ncbi:MAG TPA: hypothetical protein VN812_20205 [Candidatus Acidoferrales bacterium]|nr:hypothetical protein [Candidatus Acidoferrales bacterium]